MYNIKIYLQKMTISEIIYKQKVSDTIIEWPVS